MIRPFNQSPKGKVDDGIKHIHVYTNAGVKGIVYEGWRRMEMAASGVGRRWPEIDIADRNVMIETIHLLKTEIFTSK